MKLTIASKEPTEAIRLGGALEIYDAESLKEALLHELAHRNELVLNLADVTSCDTAGVQVLCAARKSAELNDKPFRIEQPSSSFVACCLRVGLGPNGFGEDQAA